MTDPIGPPTVTCNVVVADDIESGRIEDLVGKNLAFLAVPRIGESISGLGIVVAITHYPADMPTRAHIQIYTRRHVGS